MVVQSFRVEPWMGCMADAKGVLDAGGMFGRQGRMIPYDDAEWRIVVDTFRAFRGLYHIRCKKCITLDLL